MPSGKTLFFWSRFRTYNKRVDFCGVDCTKDGPKILQKPFFITFSSSFFPWQFRPDSTEIRSPQKLTSEKTSRPYTNITIKIITSIFYLCINIILFRFFRRMLSLSYLQLSFWTRRSKYNFTVFTVLTFWTKWNSFTRQNILTYLLFHKTEHTKTCKKLGYNYGISD